MLDDADDRPRRLTFQNGDKAAPIFTSGEYERRLAGLRAIMGARGLDAVILTSMHGVHYHSGFLYCAFGRPYAMVVDRRHATTVSAMIDGGQPWRRSHGENLIYTDWRRDNFQTAVASLTAGARRIGVEGDHLTLAMHAALKAALPGAELVDMAPEAMRFRMRKSDEEIALIREGARIADIGGEAVRDAIRIGVTEIEAAHAGREATEVEIARAFPGGELRDTWVWLQSGRNTDGAHNPLTTRRLGPGDILSMNVFPMISGYYTALERTLYLGDPDPASLRVWEANVEAHELGLSLIRPGARCGDICRELNRFFADRGLLGYRSFGYGHSFGVLSWYYGREAGLELREDVETALEPGMVVSMEPMLTIPEGAPGAGGYREHDILVVTPDGAENVTGFGYGPEANVIPV